MNAGGDHVAIDVEAMTSNFERKLSRNRAMPSRCSIFKIPTILSRHTKHAYIPNAFSIGPFHRDNPHLKPTERIKKKYMLDLISRLSNKNPPIRPNNISDMTLLRSFTEEISKAQNEAHEYYAGPIEMETDEFVEMLVLDGCFIIELFRKNAYPSLGVEEDPIFTMSCMLQFLYHDLILLENQIPWFVLDTLFELTKTESIDTKPLVRLAIEFFPSLLIKKSPLIIENILSAIKDCESKHILDLLRNSLIYTSGILKRKSTPEWQHIRSATGLRDYGITFEKEMVSDSILDIRFCPKSGIMSIPPLLIQETTETVFRNLISLEQCCPEYKPIITCYAVLLDNLIDTNDDIQVLDHKSKVIVNWLNIDDAIKFFNKLYIDAYVKENYYYEVTDNVDKYCKHPWPRYRRVLMHNYFNHPWALISVIAAFVALVLTFLQTLYTMKGN